MGAGQTSYQKPATCLLTDVRLRKGHNQQYLTWITHNNTINSTTDYMFNHFNKGIKCMITTICNVQIFTFIRTALQDMIADLLL